MYILKHYDIYNTYNLLVVLSLCPFTREVRVARTSMRFMRQLAEPQAGALLQGSGRAAPTAAGREPLVVHQVARGAGDRAPLGTLEGLGKALKLNERP